MEGAFPDDPSSFQYYWWLIFAGSTAVSAILISFHLADFPIYFFCDEAIHGVESASIMSGGADTYGDRWPLFFKGYGAYHLGVSVYLQIPFEFFLGRSEFSIRSRNVVVALFAALGAALVTRRIVPGSLTTAAAPLVFVSSSFWFLHARTGFEFMISAASWIWMIAAYERLFTKRAGRAYLWGMALLAAFALTFYSYTPARGWAVLTLVVLFFAYLPSHWTYRLRTIAICSGCGLVVVPFVLKAIYKPVVAFGRMNEMGLRSTSAMTTEKLLSAWHNFVEIMDPRYWFLWSGYDRFESAERHLIPEEPFLPLYLAPFAIAGFLILLSSLRSKPLARALVLLLPVGAFPAVLVATNALRCVPIGVTYVLFGLIGMSWCATRVIRMLRLPSLSEVVAAIVLLLPAVKLYNRAIGEAPFHYHDYGFYGLQTGTQAVFGWIQKNRQNYSTINLGNDAFNGNEVLVKFYASGPDGASVRIRDAGLPCVLGDDDKSELWIVRAETWNRLENLGCPVRRKVVELISDPLGKPLFYIGVLEATEDLDAYLAAREAERRKPVRATVAIDGRFYVVEHTRLDMGNLSSLFDKDVHSIIRSDDISPLILNFKDLSGRPIREVSVTVAHCVESTVSIVTRSDGVESMWGQQNGIEKNEVCEFTFTNDSTQKVDDLTISVSISKTMDDRVHLAEVEFRE